MLQETLKALTDPARRKILELLKKQGSMTAGDLGKEFSMTGATLSHHLATLKKAGLVDCERQGTFMYYSINTSVMEDILVWMTRLMGGNNDEKTENS